MSSSLKWLLRAGVAAALLGWLFLRVDRTALGHLLAGQSLWVLLLASALAFAALVVGTLKWWILLPGEAFLRLLRLNMTANFYALVVPGQVGAEAIKAYQLGRGRTDAEAIAASVVLDKITGLLSLLALCGIGALYSALPLGEVSRLSLAALFTASATALVGLRFRVLRAFVVGNLEFLRSKWAAIAGVGGRIILFVEAWSDYLHKPALIAASLATGLLQQAIFILMVVILSPQVGFELPVFEWCWIFGLASASTILPVTIGGLGVREGVFVGLLASVSIPAEQALALSLTIFAIQVLFGLIGGALELLRVFRPS